MVPVTARELSKYIPKALRREISAGLFFFPSSIKKKKGKATMALP
jgi:hypothetical protein